MELAWMLLANHAEAPNGLLYISGGTWDTVNVNGPPPENAPEGVVAALVGTLVVRLEFHHTELGHDYPFRITIVDEDGSTVGAIDGDISADPQADTPSTWMHGSNLIIGLTGLPLPRFGEYRINIQVNRDHKGDIPFRVVRRY